MNQQRARMGLAMFRLLPAILLVLTCASETHAVWLYRTAPEMSQTETARRSPLFLIQFTPIGYAENALGVLMVKRADGRVDQLKGKGSLPLYEGDECKTEKASKASIRLDDGTQVAMNEETTFRVQVRRERAKGITRIFKLLLGEMWIKTAEPVSIEVETPVATAAIKGTEFNLRVQPDGKSILTVIEGLVEFGTPFGTCPIRTATVSYGERGKKCTKPAPIDPTPAVAWMTGLVP
jgi:ferric-dicitrate binding protein FerR (iron transport regulator)